MCYIVEQSVTRYLDMLIHENVIYRFQGRVCAGRRLRYGARLGFCDAISVLPSAPPSCTGIS